MSFFLGLYYFALSVYPAALVGPVLNVNNFRNNSKESRGSARLLPPEYADGISPSLQTPDTSKVCFIPFITPLTPLALCLVYYPFKLHTPIREREKVPQGEQRKLRPFKVHVWRLFMNFTNGVKNKCERIFQERNMLLQFAGSFPLRSRKAASPLLTREARRPGGKGNQGIKTGLPPPTPSMCKQHLIIKLKKHTNEIKTFSKWAAALRPDFMGPWPANLYLCLNWAPGKAAVRKARFWCQREGRTRPVEAERLLGNSSPASLCSPLPGASLATWDSVSKPAQTSPLWQEPSLGPASAPAHSRTCTFTPSVPTAYSFVANLKAKTEKKPQSQKCLLTPFPSGCDPIPCSAVCTRCVQSLPSQSLLSPSRSAVCLRHSAKAGQGQWSLCLYVINPGLRH